MTDPKHQSPESPAPGAAEQPTPEAEESPGPDQDRPVRPPQKRRPRPTKPWKPRSILERGPGGKFPALATLLEHESKTEPRAFWESQPAEDLWDPAPLVPVPHRLWLAYESIQAQRTPADREQQLRRLQQVHDAVLLQRLTELDQPDSNRLRPQPEVDTAIREARAIFLRGHYWKRVELESRILADQPGPDIAKAMGLSEQTVQRYEQIFCSVRRLLPTKSVMLYGFIGINQPDAERYVGWQLRALANVEGLRVFERTLEAVRFLQAPAISADALQLPPAQALECLYEYEQLIYLLISRMIPLNDRTSGFWMQLALLERLLELDEQKARRRFPHKYPPLLPQAPPVEQNWSIRGPDRRKHPGG